MSKNLSKIEVQGLINFLEKVEYNQLDSSCNDLIFDNNKENKEFAELYNSQVEEEKQLTNFDGDIVGCDIYVTQFFLKRFRDILKEM